MIDGKSFLASPPANNSPVRFAGKDWLRKILASSTGSRLRIGLTLYFLLCIGFFAVRTAHWKQVNDPAQLHYLCFLMDHGFAPYRDLLEINMPGTYLVNWSVMHTLGGGSGAWRAFDFGLLGVAAVAMIVIAWPYDWLAGFFAATLFTLWHGRDGAGQEGQRDFIIAVLLLSAYAFLFYAFRSRRSWTMFAFGLCGGMAGTIKPMPLPFMLLLLLLAAIKWKRMGEPVLRPLLYALLGLMVPLAVIGVFLMSHHSLASFWYMLHVEMPFYQSLGRVSWPKMLSLIATASVKTIALIAFAIAVMKRDWWNWEGKLLVTGILFGVASYLAQGKAFPYHRYPMFAFLFLWAGLQIIPALRAQRMVRTLAVAGVGFAAILAPIYVSHAVHKVWDPKYSDALAADLNRLGGAALSGHVQCIDMPADCDATLYQMRLVQSTGLFYDYLIFGSSQQRVIRDVRGIFWPLFQQELANHYVLYEDRSFPFAESGARAYRIYVEKGSPQITASLRSPASHP
jgi:hypothetical protein